MLATWKMRRFQTDTQQTSHDTAVRLTVSMASASQHKIPSGTPAKWTVPLSPGRFLFAFCLAVRDHDVWKLDATA